ncbi:MAG: hypothetical protein ACQESE_00150 [Nanobdellota archaeon]
MVLSLKRRIGLASALIGALMSFIASLTKTSNIVLLVASTLLIIIGIIFWFLG